MLPRDFPEVAIGKILDLWKEHNRISGEMQRLASSVGMQFDPHKRSDALRPFRRSCRMKDWEATEKERFNWEIGYTMTYRFGLRQGREESKEAYRKRLLEELDGAYQKRLQSVPESISKKWPDVKARITAEYKTIKQRLEEAPPAKRDWDGQWPTEALLTFGLTESCTLDELNAAYGDRMKRLHPDKGGDAMACKAVQIVYEKAKAFKARSEKG